jgi:hypothetical protein
MKRIDYGSDVTVLENRAAAQPRSAYGGSHHGKGQVIGANHLVREQQAKQRINPSQEAVTEIRFLPRLHRVDVRGPEEVNARESRRE